VKSYGLFPSASVFIFLVLLFLHLLQQFFYDTIHKEMNDQRDQFFKCGLVGYYFNRMVHEVGARISTASVDCVSTFFGS